jgi:hypothetical protein
VKFKGFKVEFGIWNCQPDIDLPSKRVLVTIPGDEYLTLREALQN